MPEFFETLKTDNGFQSYYQVDRIIKLEYTLLTTNDHRKPMVIVIEPLKMDLVSADFIIDSQRPRDEMVRLYKKFR